MKRLPNKKVIQSLIIVGLSVSLAGQSEQLAISRTEWKNWNQQEILQNAEIHPSHVAANTFGDLIVLDMESFTVATLSSEGMLRLTGGWGVEAERFLISHRYCCFIRSGHFPLRSGDRQGTPFRWKA